jgi:pimeloyl-ACP methyl ester carboxylesterase
VLAWTGFEALLCFAGRAGKARPKHREKEVSFIHLNGRKIYYEIHGEGDTILLLHHGFGCTKIWKDIYPSLLEKGYRIVMYDRRGYGKSEAGGDFQEFYVSDQFRPESVNDLSALREIFELEWFHIIGQCEGGVVAVDYAVKYPDQVKSIVVSSTQCFSATTMKELNAVKFPKVFRDLEPDLKEKLIDWHGTDNAESFFNQFRQFGGAYGKDFFDLRPLLPSVSCPTLVLYPDRSFIFDVEQAVAFYRHLPNGELAVLPNCGHNAYEHQPQEYVRAVLNFLKRHDF